MNPTAIEIIFISGCRAERDYEQYYRGMPWLAMPFDRDRSLKIMNNLGVEGYPTLIVLSAEDGKPLDHDAAVTIYSGVATAFQKW